MYSWRYCIYNFITTNFFWAFWIYVLCIYSRGMVYLALRYICKCYVQFFLLFFIADERTSFTIWVAVWLLHGLIQVFIFYSFGNKGNYYYFLLFSTPYLRARGIYYFIYIFNRSRYRWYGVKPPKAPHNNVEICEIILNIFDRFLAIYWTYVSISCAY